MTLADELLHSRRGPGASRHRPGRPRVSVLSVVLSAGDHGRSARCAGRGAAARQGDAARLRRHARHRSGEDRRGRFPRRVRDCQGGPRRVRIENAGRRLMGDDYPSLEERINLERNLVELLQDRCERLVLGYTVRRERYGADYSQGVENVGYDALEGLASAIFPRTVKLRDFPWNGWLNVAAPAPPSSAWNPVGGGFGDAFGRLVWS